MILSKVSKFYKRFEKYISAVGLIYGFIFTSLTLTRVDNFLENFWVVLHLLMAALGITFLTYYENRSEQKSDDIQEKIRFYFTLVIQFGFGGLFSTFFVFYLRSSSVAESWLFLLVLLVLLFGNELWKKHYKRLAFQISVLFVSLYLFLIFLLPVLFHRLGADLFIAAGILGLLITLLFLYLLSKFAREKFYTSRKILSLSLGLIFVLMNVMYFTDIIPPIPLALKNSGVYHSIVKNSTGNYDVQTEAITWKDYLFVFTPVFHARAGETIYAFSAIFSPVKFATEVVHEWQYYNEAKKEWVDSGRVTLPIVGGRDGGFRTYSLRQNVTPGRWRVKVLTPLGQVIGTINFWVERVVEPRVVFPQLLN